MQLLAHSLSKLSYAAAVASTLALSSLAAPQSEDLIPYERAQLRSFPGTTSEQFGAALDLCGNTAFVGATRAGGDERGAVYVFERTGDQWALQQELLAPDSESLDRFGRAVAVDGDWALIGAPLEDDLFNSSGAVYAFHRVDGSWTFTQKFYAQDAGERHRFGSSIDLQGSTAAIGSHHPSASGMSSVSIFELDGDTWVEDVQLQRTNPLAGDGFGWDLELDGDVLVVGSNSTDLSLQGRVHIYRRTGNSWLEEAFMSGPFRLGFDVSVSGDRVVTSFGDSALVIAYQFGFWSSQLPLLTPDPLSSTPAFPLVRVAIEGDAVLLGTPIDALFATGTGAAFLFTWNGLIWEQSANILPDTTGPNENFGGPVCMDGDTAAISLISLSPQFLVDERVFVYTITTGPGIPFCEGIACPCGNNDPGGGCINSTGQGARVEGTGSRSTATDDLVLTASGFGPGESGIWFMGAAPQPPIAVGDGLACTGGQFRFLPSMTSAAGDLTLSGIVNAAPVGTIAAGDTRYFQAWCRDILCGPPPAPCPTPCGQGSNVSSGYAVLFTP